MNALKSKTVQPAKYTAAIAHAPDIERQAEHKPSSTSKEAFVSWLFLIGSLMFVVDGVLENLQGVSFSSVLHLTASILFTIGSVLFIPSDNP